jgi:UDP-N-acetylmuramoyl-tripeptide--D-alanyl-D-alanine ligase
MIPVSLTQLADILQAELIPADELVIQEVTTDTRKVTSGCLFIALKGERFDGHDFAQQAVDDGASALLVSKRLPIDIPQLIVKDTRLSLGLLGHWVRMQSSAQVVALTGSSGKTSVKEMAAAILKQCGNVLYTAGNLNNDIGVPLTLLRLTPQHQFAVIELGANHIGEIAYTVGLTKPASALVNNLSAAHLEGFGSLAGVAQAKGEIFDGLAADGIAIINLDSHDWLHWQAKLKNKTVWRFSTQYHENADFYADDIQLTQTETVFTLHSPLGQSKITLPLLGVHNIANALAASALAISVGASLQAVTEGLSLSRAVKGRLFPIKLNDEQLLLDDTYNANVGSMTAAVQVLSQMSGYRVMVVGDMGELGDDAVECHKQVGQAAKQAGIDCVLSVGKLSQFISSESGSGRHFADKAALTEHILELLKQYNNITLLIKGSRSAAMEQVIQGIQEKLPC